MEIIVIFLLILLNGIFSMAEIALVSVRKNRLEKLVKRGNKNAKIALDLANSPNKFLSTVQIGITLIGILTGVFSADKITHDMQTTVERVYFFRPYASTIAIGIVVIIITFFSMVLGELVPKRIGLANPELIAQVTARPMKVISIVTAPYVWLLSKTANLIIRIFNIKPTSDNKVTEEEIKAMVEEGAQGGEVQEIEQEIVDRVFSMGDRKVSSLMTHRSDLLTINIQDGATEIIKKVTAKLHSVYPVIKEPDELVGVIHLKDLFAHVYSDGFDLQQHVKNPNYVHENKLAYEVMEEFKKSKVHYAIVIDEHGQMEGMLTLNDVLEALVGDATEFHSDDYSIKQRSDGSYLIDGQLSFHDFLNYFDMDDFSGEYNYNTLSGLVLDKLEKIPVEGDTFRWMNFSFEIIDMDGARIDKILVKTIPI